MEEPKRFTPRVMLALLAGTVLFASVLGYAGLRNISGPVTLAAEPVDPGPTRMVLQLNETDVRTQAPSLAAFLDEAVTNGTARAPDPQGEARAYLEDAAYDRGVQTFLSSPLKGHVAWQGETFRIFYLRG